MVVTAMRIKSVEAATGSSRSKTISPIAFVTGGNVGDVEKNAATKYMAQRIVGLTTNTYGSTDRIVTFDVDTEVTDLG